jgi:hypothetical protein
MWRSRSNRGRRSVVCIACGTSVSRSDAREYDKEGDRWDRYGKEFEHLCKGCYRELCHQPREGLESLLVDIEADGDRESAGGDGSHSLSREEFCRRYFGAVRERYGPPEEPES